MRSAAVDRRLEAIAGAPLAMLTVPNTASDPLDIDVTEPRILYALGIYYGSGIDQVIASLGTPLQTQKGAVGAQVLRFRNVNTVGMTHRCQTSESVAVFQNVVSNGPVGTPMAGCGWWTGDNFGGQGYNSSTIFSFPVTGQMNSSPRLRLERPDQDNVGVISLAYRGVHDLATRTRIINWLMQRYQVTPPPRWIALLSAAVALIWCWHAEGRSSRRQDRAGRYSSDSARAAWLDDCGAVASGELLRGDGLGVRGLVILCQRSRQASGSGSTGGCAALIRPTLYRSQRMMHCRLQPSAICRIRSSGPVLPSTLRSGSRAPERRIRYGEP